MDGEFKDFIREHDLVNPDDFILCAVSGGMDSICMAELFRKTGLKIGIAHLNHGMRGMESDKDEALCRDYAIKNNLPFHTKRLAAGTITKNFQAGAREIRYKWFEELFAAYGYTKIATAHHKDDQVENFFLKVTKNAGLDGLSGIKISKKNIIRPLLFTKKSDIAKYMFEHNIPYREDASNQSGKYDRNYIRNEVLPQIITRFPEFPNQLLSTMDKIREANLLLNYFLENFSSTIIKTDNKEYSFKLEALQRFPNPEYALYEMLKKHGFNRTQAENIYTGKTGSEISSSTARVLKDRDHIIIRSLEKDEFQPIIINTLNEIYPISDSRGVIIQLKDTQKIHAEFSILVSKDNIQFPLFIRTRKPGEEFYPKGMKMQSKKIKKFLTDLKLNKYEKDEVLLLTNADDEIIWVIGYRQDERFTAKDIDSEQLLISVIVR